MKYPVLGLLGVGVVCSLSACTSSKEPLPHAALDVRPRLEELTTEVPKGFSESQKWNQARICPEGSVLTPFTRYEYDPGQNSHGFKHYFGRSCAIIHTDDVDAPTRKLASVDPKAEMPAQVAAVGPSISLLPHGPFIWWYENGRRMETGSFEHGTLTIGSSQYEPDGTIAAKD